MNEEDKTNKYSDINVDLRQPYALLATWFGSGLMRKAPGTWGSLAAIPFGIFIYLFFGPIGLVIATFLVSIIGYWSADQFEKETGIHDSKMVVIDEVVGQWIALLPVFYLFGYSVVGILIAFSLFRAFDIIKPWPVSYFDRKVEGAAGVMGDDLVAGLIAALIIIGAYYAAFS